jgi:hypothetical protein
MRYTGLGEALIYSVRGEPFDSAQESLVEALPPFGWLRTGLDRL